MAQHYLVVIGSEQGRSLYQVVPQPRDDVLRRRVNAPNLRSRGIGLVGIFAGLIVRLQNRPLAVTRSERLHFGKRFDDGNKVRAVLYILLVVQGRNDDVGGVLRARGVYRALDKADQNPRNDDE